MDVQMEENAGGEQDGYRSKLSGRKTGNFRGNGLTGVEEIKVFGLAII